MDHRGNEIEAGYTDNSQIVTPSGNPSSGFTRAYFKSDDNLYKKTAGGVESVVGAGGNTSYKTIMNSLSGKVHHWNFTEPSGNFADSINGLTLVPGGTVTYNADIASPVNQSAVQITLPASALVTSGLGSIPTGTNPRSFVFVYKTPSSTAQLLAIYGALSANARQVIGVNFTGSTDQLNTVAYSDNTTNASGLSFTCGAFSWQILVVTLESGGNSGTVYAAANNFNSKSFSSNTSSSGNFSVGAGTGTVNLYMDDLVIFNRALQVYEARKLINALGF